MRAAILAMLLLPAVALAQPALTRPPRLIHFEEAVYPPAARAAGIAATVVLSLEIDAAGAVTSATVVGSGGPEFDAAAVAAARKFRFEPAEVDGVAAPVVITYRYRFVLREEPPQRRPPQVNFEGQVLDRFARTPLAGVTVRVVDVGVAAITDAEGRFAFTDVPAGTHPVEISGPTIVSVTTEEEIAPDRRRAVVYRVEPQSAGEGDDVDEEIEIRASRLNKDATDFHIAAGQARRVAGTQGDTLKVVHNLPGVARAAVGSGDLVVWGSSPADTRVYVDGVEIPSLYHLGGLRSTLPSDLVAGVDLVPGAYGAEHGRGLGGLVAVTTGALPDGLHGRVSADLLDASALVSASAGRRVRVAGALRHSYLDRALAGALGPEVGDFFPIPTYRDGLVKAEVSLRRDESIAVVALGAMDELRRQVPSDDPALARREDQDLRTGRVYLQYRRLLPGGASLSVTPFAGADHRVRTTAFGGAPTGERSRQVVLGLRAGYRARVATGTTVALGADARSARARMSRSGSITLPPREGDITVFGQPPGDDVNADRWVVDLIDVAPHATLEWERGPLSLRPGIRVDAYLVSSSRTMPRVGDLPAVGTDQLLWAIEPRAAARLAVNRWLSLHAAAGRYHQPPDPVDLSATFGNPGLGLAAATHVAAGPSLALGSTTRLELTGFARWLDDLPVRTPEPTPMLARALEATGDGRSFGGQIRLRQEARYGLYGWIGYSLSRSERRRRDEPWRLFDFDQTHVLTAVASWEVGDWTFGGRTRWATGAPRTRVVDSFYDARTDRHQPIFGDHNAIRLADFAQLDVRVDRRFRWPGLDLELFLELQNATARENAEELAYNSDYTESEPVTGLPPLAVVGARVEF